MSYRMTEATQTGLGYDDYGNAAHLLTEADKKCLETHDWIRVGGDAECKVCKCAYRIHPAVQGCLWLVRGCDGLVKL